MFDTNLRKALVIPNNSTCQSTAVLASGGLQSGILTAILLEKFKAVYPVYTKLDSKVQAAEEHYLRRFLAAIRGPHLGRITVLNRSDNEQYLDDQTVLLSKAAVWCAVNDIETLVIGSIGELIDNSDLLAKMGSAIETTVGKPVSIISPFKEFKRQDIMQLGHDLPLEFTFSCQTPIQNSDFTPALHCGQCQKCNMRKSSFAESKIADRTIYANAIGHGNAMPLLGIKA